MSEPLQFHRYWLYHFKVESLYEENLDTYPAHEPKPWLLY